MVVLTNKNSSVLPRNITFTAIDRMLDLPEVPWNARFKSDDAVVRAGAKAAKERAEADRVSGTTPAHPLADYAGAYVHPGYGRLLVEEKDDGLQVRYNALVGPLTHRHYDIFEHDFRGQGIMFPFRFVTDALGDVASVAVPMEPMVAEIVFQKQAPAEMSEPSFLERLIGTYDLNGQPLRISFKDATTLQAAIPDTPVADLTPRRGTEFRVGERTGHRIEFTLDETGPATGLVVITPALVLTASRRASDAS